MCFNDEPNGNIYFGQSLKGEGVQGQNYKIVGDDALNSFVIY